MVTIEMSDRTINENPIEGKSNLLLALGIQLVAVSFTVITSWLATQIGRSEVTTTTYDEVITERLPDHRLASIILAVSLPINLLIGKHLANAIKSWRR